ncbi:hypothetical protein ACFFRR_010069 [Megaselia abdita]
MKVLILVVLTVALVNGQAFISRSGFNPDYPNQCYFKESIYPSGKLIDKAMNYDEVFRPIGLCIKAKCRSDRVLDLNYCQRYNVPDGCEVIRQDLTKEYPECCEKLKCRDGKNMIIRDITTEIVQ